MHLTIENVKQLMLRVSKDLLVYCFPSLSNALFKLLLLEFKCSSKSIVTGITCVLIAYKRIISKDDNYSLRVFLETQQKSSPNSKAQLNRQVVNLLELRQSKQPAAKSEEKIAKKEEVEVSCLKHQLLMND